MRPARCLPWHACWHLGPATTCEGCHSTYLGSFQFSEEALLLDMENASTPRLPRPSLSNHQVRTWSSPSAETKALRPRGSPWEQSDLGRSLHELQPCRWAFESSTGKMLCSPVWICDLLMQIANSRVHAMYDPIGSTDAQLNPPQTKTTSARTAGPN